MSQARIQAGVRLPQPLKPGKQSQPGVPLDPNELSRRLLIVLANQNALAERKRPRARAEAAKVSDRRSREKQTESFDGKHLDKRRQPSQPTSSHDASQTPVKSAAESHAQPVLRHVRSLLDRARRKSSALGLNAQIAQGDAAAPAAPHPYVPREAAAQFTLTTTAVRMREGGGLLTHKLSRNALKFHLNGDVVDPSAPPCEQTKALKRAQSKREKIHDRNQFQLTRTLEDAAELEHHHQNMNRTQATGSHRHSLAGGSVENNKNDLSRSFSKRRSAGDFIERTEHLAEREEAKPGRHSLVLFDSIPEEPSDPSLAHEHRVDWTQSDEAKPRKSRPSMPPLLKRPASIWHLGGRLGSASSNDSKEGDGVRDAASQASEPASSKSSKSGFCYIVVQKSCSESTDGASATREPTVGSCAPSAGRTFHLVQYSSS